MPDTPETGERPLPYLIHTNRELGLMLKGAKPLAVFGWIEGYEIDSVSRYLRMFDRHVAGGSFAKHQRVRPVPQLPNLREYQVCYTLPGHEWRVDALHRLFDTPEPWTAAHERRFGELLGYEDWQNNIWLKGFHQAEGPR